MHRWYETGITELQSRIYMRPTDSADVKSRLQRSDTSSMPPINVVFFLCRESLINTHLGNDPELIVNTHQCS